MGEIKGTRIGIVSTWYPRGCGYVARQLRDALREFGCIPHIFCRREEHFADWGPWHNQHAIRIKKPRPVQMREWVEQNKLKLVIFIEERSWDLVEAIHDITCTMQLPMIDQIRGVDIEPLERFGNVMVLTQESVTTLQRYAVPNTRIGWGFLESEWEAIKKAPATKEMWKTFPKGKIKVLHPAGWSGIGSCRKNSAAAIRVCARVARESDDFVFILTTQHPWEEYPKDLRNLVDETKDSWIIHSGNMPESKFRRLMVVSDLVFCPARHEGLGLTYIEAMGAGTPCLTIDCPPMNEYIEHGINGWLCSAQHWRQRPPFIIPSREINEEDAYQYFQRLKENPDEAIRLRHGVLETRRNFDWEIGKEQFRSVILDCLPN